MTDPLAELIGRILQQLGHTPGSDPELDRTPERFAQLLRERFAPPIDPPSIRPLPSAAHPGDRIIVRDLPFHSMCVHHLVPFFGHVHIAYRPRHHILGFGSFGRIVDAFARRPQLQERMTAHIADHLADLLAPDALVVVSHARQMCMDLTDAGRGATTECFALRGDDPDGIAPALVDALRTRASA
jgi:GTP cyclohydrolase I